MYLKTQAYVVTRTWAYWDPWEGGNLSSPFKMLMTSSAHVYFSSCWLCCGCDPRSPSPLPWLSACGLWPFSSSGLSQCPHVVKSSQDTFCLTEARGKLNLVLNHIIALGSIASKSLLTPVTKCFPQQECHLDGRCSAPRSMVCAWCDPEAQQLRDRHNLSAQPLPSHSPLVQPTFPRLLPF